MIISMVKRGKEQEEPQNDQNKEEFVQVLDDGTRLNTSTKLQETKKVEGLEISDFQVTAKNGATELLGTVTNTSSTAGGGFLANLKIMDKQGQNIYTAQVYIKPLEPGESTPLISNASFDYANAYDFSVSRVNK